MSSKLVVKILLIVNILCFLGNAFYFLNNYQLLNEEQACLTYENFNKQCLGSNGTLACWYRNEDSFQRDIFEELQIDSCSCAS